ncbi:MAG TPA: non-canonical purine NTP pyrophosphatase, partial [Prosthecobacter sp.]|nr:non-canonical purine NTP pyrophosphatase [Prosthecobacter sp.]
MPRLLLATSNAHKTAEVAAMLGAGWRVEDMRAHPGLALPEETGVTFEENAVIKARGASAALPGLLVLADDSGLEVDALGGEPGVYSARYGGEGAGDKGNRERLKRELANVATDKADGWAARFRCCMAVARDGVTLAVFDGAVEGRIIATEQGAGGFGYDPLFVPDGFADTFGVLPSET